MEEIKELQNKVNDLQRENEEIRNQLQELEDLKRKIENTENIARNHRHKGGESIPLETLIKEAEYIDGKEFRAEGTAGGTQTFVLSGEDIPTTTFVIKNGLVISITQ
jgi:predicted RNase H-like nuclease (RuvC/YqgF family)